VINAKPRKTEHLNESTKRNRSVCCAGARTAARSDQAVLDFWPARPKHVRPVGGQSEGGAPPFASKAKGGKENYLPVGKFKSSKSKVKSQYQVLLPCLVFEFYYCFPILTSCLSSLQTVI
jgi:hypothetical protein